jgi:integrase
MTIFSNSVLPFDAKGKEMKIDKVGTDPQTGIAIYQIDCAYRRGDGRPTHIKRQALGSTDLAVKIAQIQEVVEGGSLTVPYFEQCIEYYLQNKGFGGFSKACYDLARKQLGKYRVNKVFRKHYVDYNSILVSKGIKPNTRNNYRTVVRSILHFSVGSLLEVCPVTDFLMEQFEYRDRVWDHSERQRLFDKLSEWDSHLIMAIYFMAKNPIRKNDLRRLTRKNLISEAGVSVVQFVAGKTSRSAKGKLTTLPNIDHVLLDYWTGLPPGCPWLFPMVGTERNGMHTKMKPGAWRQMGDFDRHFNSLCDAALVVDFTIHDLKHCAITYMMEQGYTYEELRKLGIQFSPKTAAIYDNRSAVDIVRRRVGAAPQLGVVSSERYQEAV